MGVLNIVKIVEIATHCGGLLKETLVLNSLTAQNIVEKEVRVNTGAPGSNAFAMKDAKEMNKCVKLKECEEKCGKGGLCYESSVGEFHVCTQCGEGFILNENECIELTSDPECNEKCGKGALCYNKQCETCGEGKTMTGSSINRCRKTTPCDELCGPGGLCYEN